MFSDISKGHTVDGGDLAVLMIFCAVCFFAAKLGCLWSPFQILKHSEKWVTVAACCVAVPHLCQQPQWGPRCDLYRPPHQISSAAPGRPGGLEGSPSGQEDAQRWGCPDPCPCGLLSSPAAPAWTFVTCRGGSDCAVITTAFPLER